MVFQVIGALAEQAHAAGKPLSVCGEMAADPALLPVLAGLGVTDVSVAPGVSQGIRSLLGSSDATRCRNLASQCLRADSSADVRALLGRVSAAGTRPQALSRGEVLDPVCAMVVRAGDTPYVLHLDGTTHHFCSRSCMNRFAAGFGR